MNVTFSSLTFLCHPFTIKKTCYVSRCFLLILSLVIMHPRYSMYSNYLFRFEITLSHLSSLKSPCGLYVLSMLCPEHSSVERHQCCFVFSSSVKRLSKIHFPKRGLISNNDTAPFSFSLTEFTYFLVLCFAFGRHLNFWAIFGHSKRQER